MEAKTRGFSVFPLLAVAILTIGTIWLYWEALVDLTVQLATDEDYSFGLLLPLVSGYLCYLKLPQIRAGRWRPSWMGLGIIILALLLFMLGEAGTGRYLKRLSFLVFLTGLVTLLGGWGLLKLLSFPILLLFLTIPLPLSVTAALTLSLQLVSSRLAAFMLRFSGIPIFRQGNVLDLGNRQLELVAACSGLRYILALFALGCIFCYFYQRRPWKVAVLLLSLIPAAIVANAIRVAGMGLWPVLQQPGFWHLFSGWLIFIICFAFLVVINWVLNRLQLPRDQSEEAEAPAAVEEAPGRPEPSLRRYLAAASVMVLLAVPLIHYICRVEPTLLLQSFDRFPLRLGPWDGHLLPIDPEMAKATGSHDQFNAEFSTPGQKPVSVWIAYYRRQETEGIGHTPRYCLPGSGWRTIDEGVTNIAPGMAVNYMVMSMGSQRILVYYWNLVGGQLVTNDRVNKLYLMYKSLVSRRNDAALIRLITTVDNDLNLDQERLSGFARLLVPALHQFIPN